MIKTILSLLILFTFLSNANAQCYELSLTSQAELDAWIAANSAITTISHDTCFTIGPSVPGSSSDIVDLTGLINIQEIYFLEIVNNPLLINLEGLNNLSVIGGGVVISENDALENLQALESLEVAHAIRIFGNDALTSLGFDNLSLEIETLYIRDNQSLQNLLSLSNFESDIYGQCDIRIENNENLISLNGLEGMTDMKEGSLVISDNNSLTNLSGLDNVHSVFNLRIANNKNLTSLHALNNLQSIDWALGIVNNDSLLSLDGLSHITFPSTVLNFSGISIENNNLLSNIEALQFTSQNEFEIYIKNNPELSNCSVASLCNYVMDIDNYIEMENNLQGCNTRTEILDNCITGINPLDKNMSIKVFPNPFFEEVQITIENTDFEFGNIEVYDFSGRRVLKKTFQNENINLGELDFSSGIYFYKIILDDNYYSGKIYKQ